MDRIRGIFTDVQAQKPQVSATNAFRSKHNCR